MQGGDKKEVLICLGHSNSGCRILGRMGSLGRARISCCCSRKKIDKLSVQCQIQIEL